VGGVKFARADLSSARLVGLEVTDVAVRAASVQRGRPRTAEVELPAGAVVQGEVVDPAAVSAAVRELWRVGKFASKRVALGVAGRDVVARQLDVTPLTDADLRSALRYELADMIPFPSSESMLDFVRIETVEDDQGGAVDRVLAVAAHRLVIDDVVAAVRHGGLSVARVDLSFFALIRAAAQLDPPEGPRALVHVGPTTMVVVVHDRGSVRFARQVDVGAAADDEALALQAELAFVEQARQRGGGPAGGAAVLDRIDPVASALTGTIEYYSIQPGAPRLEAIDLIGDPERIGIIARQLEGSLSPAPRVAVADPVLDGSDRFLEVLAGPFATTAGLVIDPTPERPGPAPLQLLPPKPDPSVRTVLLRATLVAVGTAAVVAGLALGSQSGVDVEAEAVAAEDEAARFDQRLRELGDANARASEARQRSDRVAAIEAQRVPWEGLVERIRAAAPPGTTIKSIMATPPQETPTGPLPGKIELTVTAPSRALASVWLLELGEIPGLVDPWLRSVGTADLDGAEGESTFALSATVEDDLEAVRAALAPEGGS